MKKIVLDLTAVRAEIGIWQDSADDSFTKYSNERADQKKKKEYSEDYEEYTAIVNLLTNLQQDPNVIVNKGVSNREINDKMYELLEDIDNDLFLLDSQLPTDEEDEESLSRDFKSVFKQFEYLIDLVVDEF